jgi:hypothetical protein
MALILSGIAFNVMFLFNLAATDDMRASFLTGLFTAVAVLLVVLALACVINSTLVKR